MRYFLLLLLVLAACSQGPADFVHTGSKGITLEFAEGFPEHEVYEQSPLPISLSVKNEGTWSVAPNRFLLTWSYDPLYIHNSAENTFFPLDFVFEARSDYYPEGDFVTIEEYNFATNKIIGQRESPETDLHALACYEYATRFVQGVCLDVDSYLKTGREQVCSGGTVSAASQGAPVAFKQVEVRVRPQGTEGTFPAMRPEIIATLQNVGSGTVLSPPIEDFQSACALNIDQSLLNGVAVRGSLMGYELYCEPAVVKFRQGEARVRCTFTDESFNPDPEFSIFGDDCSNPETYDAMSPEEKFVCIQSILTPVAEELPGLDGLLGPTVEDCYGGDSLTPGRCDFTRDTNPLILQSNIMTVLALEARYIYRDSVTHELTLQRNIFEEDGTFSGKAPVKKGYVYDDDFNLVYEDGSALTKCALYASDQSSAPGDLPDMNPEFSCGCSRNECVEMDDFGFCVHGLCPGTLECCDAAAYESFKKAASNEGRGESG